MYYHIVPFWTRINSQVIGKCEYFTQNILLTDWRACIALHVSPDTVTGQPHCQSHRAYIGAWYSNLPAFASTRLLLLHANPQ